MLFKVFLALNALILSILAFPGSIQKPLDDTKCAKVRIFGIRGTLEKYPYGELQGLVDSIKGKLDDVDDIAVDYPATGIDIIEGRPYPKPVEYALSERAGIENFTSLVVDYVEECPDSQMVFLGYSQGAHVVGDVLCGRSSFGFGPTLPIDSYFTYNLRAIIQLGDPTNVPGLPWHQGTGDGIGIFARPYFAVCSKFGDNWQSWCDDQDIFCTREGNITAHELYVKKYTQNITDFVIEKLKDEPEEDKFTWPSELKK